MLHGLAMGAEADWVPFVDATAFSASALALAEHVLATFSRSVY